jgi:GDP-4-dehydro-6-deoxy-D-mannose reductase
MMVSYSEGDIEIVVDETKLRPSDIPNFVGNNSKLKKDTGWQQIFSIEDTVRDVLDFWTRIDEDVQ